VIDTRPLERRTARCVLRPLTPGDADRLHAVWSSAGVRRFLWDDEEIPLDRTRQVIEQSRQLFDERRFGLWGAWSASAAAARENTLCGFGGLWPFRDSPEVELLYGVAEDRWGQGYAFEIAGAVLEYCFDVLAMPLVRASTDVGNAASIRVLEKLGGRFDRRADVGGLDTVFYELSAPPARLGTSNPNK
jgi:RimJ/RimL family protein N-acetyltransferase